MKRAPWYVLAGTLAGFFGVLGLHGRAASPAGLPQSKRAPGGTGQTQGGARSAQSAGQPSPSASTSGPVSSGAVRTATGTLEQYGYGELKVRVTVRGSEIIGVSVPTLRTAEPYSQQIAVQVLPMLRSQVLSSHSASVGAVSGATYTSQAYAASLQSALDKLHVR
jgi:uncharacterized protein with FMN-binding domain